MAIRRNACSLLTLPDFPEFAQAVRYGVPGTLSPELTKQLGMVSPELTSPELTWPNALQVEKMLRIAISELGMVSSEFMRD
jgi:hypothetical protein